MAAVSEHEIQPGLVVFLDPQILRSLGDSFNPTDEPIRLPLDFEFDVELRKMGGDLEETG
jgi:hypothetical protein